MLRRHGERLAGVEIQDDELVELGGLPIPGHACGMRAGGRGSTARREPPFAGP
eukprot:CAMPEP_0183504932 /NCGR_PEP_ID=MMETSP0371-20130417/6286_1 /TAXON_ID=268820 /ORGANISM="Peridinium aciculiferum, Strain PAER-2" /LENGTH=52 /DNA_ID=CAMNT_0025700467 /DNA_START=34 /DNA_END=188 /DNA_ORIENTATION=+